MALVAVALASATTRGTLDTFSRILSTVSEMGTDDDINNYINISEAFFPVSRPMDKSPTVRVFEVKGGRDANWTILQQWSCGCWRVLSDGRAAVVSSGCCPDEKCRVISDTPFEVPSAEDPISSQIFDQK
jgi:hypothetical protein